MSNRDPVTHVGQRVNNEGQAAVEALSYNGSEHVNRVHGDAYTMDLDSVTIAGGGQWLAVIKNTDDRDMIVTSLTYWTNSAHEDMHLEVWLGGTFAYAANGTVVVPTNCNAGSGKTASGSFYKNDGGGDMTTLSGQAVCSRTLPKTTVQKLTKDSGWVVPKNQVWALKMDKDGMIRGYVSFYYHNG